MAESKSRSETQKVEMLFSNAEMDAAQQLLRLRKEDSVSKIEKEQKIKRVFAPVGERERRQDGDHEASDRTMIKQISGTEKEIIYRPKKEKLRSLVDIYKATTPITERR